MIARPPADECTPLHLSIPFFNGYAWGYAGEGPKALAEAILFDYTQDPRKIQVSQRLDKERNPTFRYDKGFILTSSHIEAAMRSTDRQQAELERKERKQQRRFQFYMWRSHPWRAMGTLVGWAKDAYSEHEYLLGIIGFVLAVLGFLALFW